MQRVNLIGPDAGAMADLVRVHGVSVVRQTARRLDGGRWRVQAFGEAADLAALAGHGFTVEPVEDVAAASPGTGGLDRAAAGGAAPGPRAARTGPAGYMDVAEVDRRLAVLASPPYAEATELIDLPHETWEKRTCRALRIGPGPGGGERPGICLLGGVHAREWGSADILVALAERLLGAWQAGKGIAIGRRRFGAAAVRRLIEEADIFLVPQVNPDGRHHSFTVDPMWRKNRRPAPAGAPEHCVGVDLNRNFDFLWDFATHFDPAAPVACSSQPCDLQVYVGPEPASEPETRNVVWLLDEHPEIAFLVDLHSYGELIMYSWGDDENQTVSPDMAFTNPGWDRRRGAPGDDYREHIAVADAKLLARLAARMQAGVAAARGRRYRVQQSMSLYPTAGTSDDYAYSRHLVDPGRPKILAFTVEWGAEDNPTPFHPPYDEMVQVIAEMTSGLLAFCGAALRVATTHP